jgi:cytochrome c-type biogenesis protein
MMTVTAAAVLASSGEVVRDGSLLIALPIAAVAGLVSFLSPCVLPLVPAYLSYVTGLSSAELANPPATSSAAKPGTGANAAQRSRSVGRVVVGSAGFVGGIAIVFVSFGALFGQLGQLMRDNEALLVRIFGVVTIILGLMLAGAFGRIPLFNRELRLVHSPRAGFVGAALLGLTFALGWTPCIGPTLGSVLGLAASSNRASAARGAVLSVAYCAGLGIPFFATGLAFSRAMQAIASIKRHYRAVMTIGGSLLVVLGILQVSGLWTRLMGEVQTWIGPQQAPL